MERLEITQLPNPVATPAPAIAPVDEAYHAFKTENDMLEMSKHFKEVLEDKQSQIVRLTKVLCTAYGLVRICDDNMDSLLLPILREVLSIEFMKLTGLED
tara:strand:+ start:3315 stop:3614 length:300 start_codon:yes stop_codon:yes gene_type:complete